MERSQNRAKEEELNVIFDHIFRNAFGLPIIFDTAPVNSTMKANTWGIYSTDLYIKTGSGVTLKIAGSSV